MKFGVCTGPENLETAARLGFDYIECTVSGTEAMSDADYNALLARVNASPIKIERFNVLFPITIKLTGPEADHGKIRAYLDRAFKRVKALGGTAVVFGSGKSRAFPADMPFRDAFGELVKVTKIIGEAASKYGIIIAIEPLNRGECNCINSVKEGAMLEAAADHPSVQLLADNYHMLKDNEPWDNILAVKKLRHTHISFLEGRAYPTHMNDDVRLFFGALKKISYDGTMSIEGKAENFEADCAASIKVLRSAAL